MDRIKFFVKNIIIYGIGGVIGKAIPFIMLPIITRLIPNSTYIGLNDMVATLNSFLSAFIVMGMYDACFRIIFDFSELEGKRQVFQNALFNTICIGIPVVIIMMLFSNNLSRFLFGEQGYSGLWKVGVATALFNAINNVLNVPIRALDRKKTYLILNSIVPAIPYVFSIPMIYKGEYLYALPLSTLMSAVVQFIILLIVNHKWFVGFKVNKRMMIELLEIGVPLMPCFLAYWVFNSCDKIMIINTLGAKANGVYSIGGKFGQISQFIYLAFAGGWQLFAFSTMQDDDQVEMTTKIMEILSCVSFVAGIFMLSFGKWIYDLLFIGEYSSGSIVSVYLFMSPLLLMIFQTISNQFLVAKKAVYGTLCLFVGALVNIILNYVLIPILGIEGAAIATLLGYTTTIVVCMVLLIKMSLLKKSNRFIFMSFVFVGYWLICRMVIGDVMLQRLIIGVVVVLFFACLFKADIKKLCYTLFKNKDERREKHES